MRDYFKSYKHYFWVWDQDEEVLVIPDGSTIAYRPVVAELLEKMGPQGLPSFGTILLAIVATNRNVDQPLTHIRELIEQRFHLAEKNLTRVLEPAMEFLKVLSDLPDEYKSQESRGLLFRIIFANAHNNISLKESRMAIAAFQQDKLRYHHAFPQEEVIFTTFIKDFRPLALLLRKFPDVQSILEGIGGVKKLAEDIDLPESPSSDNEHELVQQLMNELETSAIGHLIPHIWAGLRIPQHQRLPDDESMGGFSDISNKGNFDRLLISEYAYDDTTFLSRLANNETLFLQRESPPSSNKESRLILIDQSLKSWGTPKMIAHAVALAIDQHPKNKRHSEIYLIGETYRSMNHENIHEIIKGVCQLEACIDAAQGIDLFFKEQQLGKQQEVFFLTNEKALTHPEMQRSMNEHREKISYLLPIDQQGNCSIFSQGRQGRKLLQKLELGHKIKESQRKIKSKKSFPFYLKNHPLLYPKVNGWQIEIDKKSVQKLVISDKKALFLFPGDIQKGLRLISEKLPSNTQIFVLGNWRKKDKALLCIGNSNRQAFLLILRTGEVLTIPFPWSLHGKFKAVFMDDHFYVFTRNSTFLLEGRDDLQFKVVTKKSHSLLEEAYHEKGLGRSLLRSDAQIVFRVRRVECSVDGLIINGHPMHFTSSSLQWNISKVAENRATLKAQRINKKTFEFADGSKVLVSPHGMIELVSSDQSIPKIYLPLELDISLGIATTNYFAGNEFYLPEDSALKKITLEAFNRKFLQAFFKNLKAQNTHES